MLYHWKQGKISPVDTDWSEEDMTCSRVECLESARHPDGSYLIYADCEACDGLIYAKISVKDGRWDSTRLLSPDDIEDEFWCFPRERRRQMKQWLSKNV